MGKLYLVPTPIGNLEDITYRAVRVLKECDMVLAEDSRDSAKLLNHYEIEKKVISYHQHNEHKIFTSIVEDIINGKEVALVTDAGTPGISDPGFLLVRECIKNNIVIECLPGATAFVPALVNSGLPSDRFAFEGFLPAKKGRKTRLEELAEENKTMVFYESPYRLEKTLRDFEKHFGKQRLVCVSRELTKIYEENVRGTVKEVLEHFSDANVKGEITIVVEGLKDSVKRISKEKGS